MKNFAPLVLMVSLLASCGSDPNQIVLYLGSGVSGELEIQIQNASNQEGGSPGTRTLTETYTTGEFRSLLLVQQTGAEEVRLVVTSAAGTRELELEFREGTYQTVVCVEGTEAIVLEEYNGSPGEFDCVAPATCEGVECPAPENECQVSACEEGACVVNDAPPGTMCADGGRCMGDTCIPPASCTAEDVSACPEPSSPCFETACTGGLCGETRLAENTACGGGLVCREGACVVPPACEDVSECVPRDCERAVACEGGECSFETAIDGTECGMGGFCLGGMCAECSEDGQCAAAECQVGVCSVDGECSVEHMADGTACADGAFCWNGACEGECGSVDDCPSDDSLCTDEICDMGSCRSELRSCDGSQICNPETGTCEEPPACTPGASECAPIPCSTASCSEGGECEYTSTCAAGEVCDVSAEGGACVECVVAETCDDGDPCTRNTCTDANECAFPAACPDSACDAAGACVECTDTDRSACDLSERGCLDGLCVECDAADDCDDSNPCTANLCRGNACVFEPVMDGSDCPGGRQCNAGVCVADSCNRDSQCEHPSACVIGSCSGFIGGSCGYDTAPADPPGPLTFVTCETGVCDGADCVSYECESNEDCDDHIECTQDICRPSGTCRNPNVEDGTSCGFENGFACESGVCVGNDSWCTRDSWKIEDASGVERYVVCSRRRTWDEAQADCEEAGGHLATFSTETEWLHVRGEIMSEVGDDAEDIWIGSRDVFPDGPSTPDGHRSSHRWIDGAPSTAYSGGWEEGEPNQRDSCARIDSGSFEWRDFWCDTDYSYICEFGRRN